MPILFLIIGAAFITYIFYAKRKNAWLILSFCLCILGFFMGQIEVLESVKINILNALSVLFLVVFLVKNAQMSAINRNVQKMLIIIGAYVLINYISIDYNYFFNFIPMCALILVVNAFENSIYNRLFVSIISILFCDIYNYVFLISKIDFVAIFSYEFILCIATSVALCFIIELLKIRRKRIEKTV